MNRYKIVIGIGLVIIGIGFFFYYDYYIAPEKEAKEMMVEAKMIFERGDRDSINQSINIFTKVIAQHPETSVIPEAYFYIGRAYENIGLHRLAYLKYSYLLKNKNPNLTDQLKKEIIIRIAHLNVMKQYTEEGVNQLYALLSTNYNKELRSRIYSELGHTYLKTGEYIRAKRMFDIALSEYGSNEEALIGRARAYKHLGKDPVTYDTYEHFLKYYGSVSQFTSDVRSAYKRQAYGSGINSFRHGNYWNAISYFNRILKNFPGDRLSENALYWTGESYFALKRFNSAIQYFNRALSNSYYHKDEDAQIKKGYAYFLNKRFDLAAREFQKYLQSYPRGKHVRTAREWKNMSTKEILYRIKEKAIPDLNDESSKGYKKSIDRLKQGDEEVAGDYKEKNTEKPVELENVAEL